jgi:hypothetical protein
MNDISKFINFWLIVAFILATLGTLAEVTKVLRNESVKTHKRGMFSLGKYNRQLHRQK